MFMSSDVAANKSRIKYTRAAKWGINMRKGWVKIV